MTETNAVKRIVVYLYKIDSETTEAMLKILFSLSKIDNKHGFQVDCICILYQCFYFLVGGGYKWLENKLFSLIELSNTSTNVYLL